jgi:hypothetical protein
MGETVSRASPGRLAEVDNDLLAQPRAGLVGWPLRRYVSPVAPPHPTPQPFGAPQPDET